MDRYPSRTPPPINDAALRASASRCPSRSSAQNRARAAPRHLLSASDSCFTATDAGRRRNHLQRRASAMLVHPHKVGRPPPAIVASGTGREHRLSPLMVADEPPGLAPEVLVERMCMAGFRRDRLAALRADGAQRRVPLCSTRAALSRQDACPDPGAPDAGEPVGAAVKWTGPAMRSEPRGDRSGAGRERPSAG
jgi:hypothetical protein